MHCCPNNTLILTLTQIISLELWNVSYVVRLCKKQGLPSGRCVMNCSFHDDPPTGVASVITAQQFMYLWLLFDPPCLQGRVGTVILGTFLKPLTRLHPVPWLFQLTRGEGTHTHTYTWQMFGWTQPSVWHIQWNLSNNTFVTKIPISEASLLQGKKNMY